jgi:hypothetical protein
MGLTERDELCRKIECHRKRPLIVYVTSKRDGASATMASDALPCLIDQLDLLPEGTEHLDFLIASFGGDPMVAWRIMSLIRERVKKVSVLIPQSAYSAATLLALGGDEIVMHPNSHLGPVDMQITTFSEGKPKRFSTEDISAFLDFVRDKLGITDQRHLRRLFEIICSEVGSLGVGFTARSSKLAVSLGERLLGMHIKGEDNSDKRRVMVETLSRQFYSHAYPVSRSEAIEIGLPVNRERDYQLEKLMWELWLDIESELKERYPFSPMIELMTSKEAAADLLSPVPQLDMPANVSFPTYFTATLNDVQTAGTTKQIKPVDFEHIDALMESARLMHQGVTRGKILASRLPNLNVQFNALVAFRGWEKVPQARESSHVPKP